MEMENNKAIARLFRQIAALQQEEGVAFKPAAYRRAAQTIEDLLQDISTYPREIKELKKLPGIGEATAEKIIEYLKTGEMQTLVKLLNKRGGISGELMDIEGLGAKRVRQIQDALGIKTTAELVEAARAGKLRGLPRFSELMEKKILEYALRVDERTKRYPRAEIEDDVEELLGALQKVKGVRRAAVAGSYRRQAETVGDIDVLIVTDEPQSVSDAVSKLSIVRDVVAHGDKKISFNLRNGIRVDIRFVREDQWGSALLYFTGNKEHNIAMRKVAIQKGWKLNEYGLFEKEKVIASKSEEEIYQALGIPFHEQQERKARLKVDKNLDMPF